MLHDDTEFLNKVRNLCSKFENEKSVQYDISVQVTIPNEFEKCAKFNIGYQGGVTEASSGGTSTMVSLCPYRTIRENCVRGSKYIFFDETSKII